MPFAIVIALSSSELNSVLKFTMSKGSLLMCRLSLFIGYNVLHASDGRYTEALNCKPITNLLKKYELPNLL